MKVNIKNTSSLLPFNKENFPRGTFGLFFMGSDKSDPDFFQVVGEWKKNRVDIYDFNESTITEYVQDDTEAYEKLDPSRIQVTVE